MTEPRPQEYPVPEDEQLMRRYAQSVLYLSREVASAPLARDIVTLLKRLAALREWADAWRKKATELQREIARLTEENRKLREPGCGRCGAPLMCSNDCGGGDV